MELNVARQPWDGGRRDRSQRISGDAETGSSVLDPGLSMLNSFGTVSRTG